VASEHKPVSTIAVTWMAAGTGLLTFIAGIAMLILVFTWAHDTLGTIDQALAKVHVAKPVQAPAMPQPLAQPGKPGAKSAQPPAPAPAAASPASVTASPGGPSLAIVAVGLLLKLFGLLVLGILAGIVAARGAHMVAGALRPPAVGP
jgi:hypothetical protein